LKTSINSSNLLKNNFIKIAKNKITPNSIMPKEKIANSQKSVENSNYLEKVQVQLNKTINKSPSRNSPVKGLKIVSVVSNLTQDKKGSMIDILTKNARERAHSTIRPSKNSDQKNLNTSNASIRIQKKN
jgi:hypothetical protein